MSAQTISALTQSASASSGRQYRSIATPSRLRLVYVANGSTKGAIKMSVPLDERPSDRDLEAALDAAYAEMAVDRAAGVDTPSPIFRTSRLRRARSGDE